MKTTSSSDFDASVQRAAETVVSEYSSHAGGVRPDWHIKNRPDGPYLVIELASPSEHHYKILNTVAAHLPEESPFKDRCTVQARKSAPKARLLLPETQLLKKVISESLTIDRNSFNEDFFARYTPSVTNFEQQITTKANFVVYGRRGAGKSSLLAYAMHTAIESKHPYSWVAMQTFSQRSDEQVIPAVVAAVLHDLDRTTPGHSELAELVKVLEELSEASGKNTLTKCDRLMPRVRKVIGQVASTQAPATLFLDDIHVLHESVQPLVLSFIYKITRGNNAYIKASGIAQLTTLWDNVKQTGLEPSHDTHVLNLDLNLTMPDKSKDHIASILDAHAKYCGLPSIGYLAGDGVLSRLVLVAAGVPRDALSLFSMAISKAAAKNQKLVSVTSINAAASEAVEEKMKDIERDTTGELAAIQGFLSEVRKFCVQEKRKNAFLVEIRNSDARYKLVQKLIALRLVHLLHEGITPRTAGQRFIALMLDYGYYVGIRAAKSVELIPDEPRQLSAKELRSLPIFQ